MKKCIGREFFANIMVLNFKKKFTKPQRRHCFTSPYMAILCLAILVYSYFYIDQALATLIRLNYDATLDHISSMLSWLGLGFPYVILLVISLSAAYLNLLPKKWIALSWLFLLALAIPGLACDLMKPILGRSRVHLLFDQNSYGFYFLNSGFGASYYSFPSGHATAIAAVMTICMLLWPKGWPIFLLLIITVGCSRICLGTHFFSDVLVGSYLGVVGAIKTYDFFLKRNWIEP